MHKTTLLHLLYSSLWLLLGFTMLRGQAPQTIVSTQAGTLKPQLVAGTTDLTVRGPIDASDILAIGKTLPDLVRLDLHDTEIKAYNHEWDYDQNTPANCFPMGLSYKSKKLEELILPATMTKVVEYAFGGLEALKRLTCPTQVVPSVYGYDSGIADEAILEQCTLFVPAELLDNFQASSTWAFKHIKTIPSESPFAAQIKIETEQSQISFTIAVAHAGDRVEVRYSDGSVEQLSAKEDALSLTFSHTFSDTTESKKLVEISAPAATRFSTQGSSLSSYTILDNLAQLREVSLRYEENLRQVNLASLLALETLTLSRCTSLTDLILPTSAPQLRVLQLGSTPLEQIHLSAYPALEELDLSGCQLTSIDLQGLAALRSLDLSSNRLAALSLAGLTALSTLRVGYNELTEITIPSTKLDELNIEHNQIGHIDLSQVTHIGAFYCNDNLFTLDQLPIKGERIGAYIYAPQAQHPLPSEIPLGEMIDLSTIAQLQGVLKTSVASSFSWYDERGTLLSEGSDYEVRGEGKFVFLQNFEGKVYCRIKTKAFPKFDRPKYYETTHVAIVAPAEKPNFAYYTSLTKQNFSVKALPGTSIRVLWADGTQSEETSDDEYGIARFAHAIDPDKVSDPERMEIQIFADHMRAFAAQSTQIIEIHTLNCPQLTRLTLKYQNLKDLKLHNVPLLEELYLDGNEQLRSVDLTELGHLRWLNVSNIPLLERLNLSETPLLTHLFAYNTHCANLNIASCPLLEELDITHTGTTQIDVSKLTNLRRLLVADNQVERLDISALTQLTEINVARNLLTELQITSEELASLNVSHNRLSTLSLKSLEHLTTLYCEDNQLSLDALPSLAIDGPAYVYAPQAEMSWGNRKVFTTDEEIDLARMSMLQGVLRSPVPSTYQCYSAQDNRLLELGKEYKELRPGVFQCLVPQAEGIYFVISTRAYPSFEGEKRFQTAKIPIIQGNGFALMDKGEIRVVCNEGILRLSLPFECIFTLYTSEGACLERSNLSTGEHCIDLSAGSYILTLQKGQQIFSYKITQ